MLQCSSKIVKHSSILGVVSFMKILWSVGMGSAEQTYLELSFCPVLTVCLDPNSATYTQSCAVAVISNNSAQSQLRDTYLHEILHFSLRSYSHACSVEKADLKTISFSAYLFAVSLGLQSTCVFRTRHPRQKCGGPLQRTGA